MSAQDLSEPLAQAVREAHGQRAPLALHGGRTKSFYGRRVAGRPLDVSGHRGIVHYEPTELVITARAGTPLAEIEARLARHRQMLPFEPPHFGPEATLGGTVAGGLAGPRRPWGGAVRDNVLGVEILNGKGERLRFGGEVMKNVAGYDLSRLMAGALGTLGVLLSVSLKVLPRPRRELTLARTLGEPEALELMQGWAARPLPLSATWYDGRDLYVRLSGGEQALRAAVQEMGGDPLDWEETFWITVREQCTAFFMDQRPLWRIALPPATPPLDLAGEAVMEWGGALRWYKGEADAGTVRQRASQAGGHATLYRGGDPEGTIFQPLPPALMTLHKRIKQALDPAGILNPGRMYPDL
jgi:glycolate oxidase FAD binding subunit